MPLEPDWIAAALAGLAAALAGFAALRARGPGRAELAQGLEGLSRDLGALRETLSGDMRQGRDEAGREARDLRGEVAAILDRLGAGLTGSFDRAGAAQAEKAEALAGTLRGLADANERRLGDMRREGEEGGQKLREEVTRQLRALGGLLGTQLEGGAAAQKERLDAVADAIRRLVQANAEANEALKRTVEGRLEALRTENAAKLEEMRRTVDEKLQGTLEERLGEKFKLVSHHLEQVHRSVGEMQSLATGVGDLKRVLTNVKARGTWAEVSLGTLLEQVLAPDQFDRNVETIPGTGERVEFAIRLPGGEGGQPTWLPIDAKFPVEDYERLVDAAERNDKDAVEAALNGLEARIRREGQTICRKYVRTPETTDFAIMYLPTEGLYGEVVRRPGLVDDLQSRCRINVAGPATLLAQLSALRMGFRSLAIQKRSGEIATTLGAVKTEFAKYGDVLEVVRKKLGEASDQIDKVAVRKRAIDRKLRSFEGEDEDEAVRLLGLNGPDFLQAAE